MSDLPLPGGTSGEHTLVVSASAEEVAETLARGILQSAGGAMPRSAECLLALAAAEHLTECLAAAGFVVLRGAPPAGPCRDVSRPVQERLALR
jgi:hypothetical protein